MNYFSSSLPSLLSVKVANSEKKVRKKRVFATLASSLFFVQFLSFCLFFLLGWKIEFPPLEVHYNKWWGPSIFPIESSIIPTVLFFSFSILVTFLSDTSHTAFPMRSRVGTC